jgi:hypothetical protein
MMMQPLPMCNRIAFETEPGKGTTFFIELAEWVEARKRPPARSGAEGVRP